MIPILLFIALVAADSTTTTKVNIEQFSQLYNGEYSSAMMSYASVLADQGYNASAITHAIQVAYGYGTNTLDQSAFDASLSSYAAEQSSIASVRATASFSFSKESVSKSGSKTASKTDSKSGSTTDSKSGSTTKSGSSGNSTHSSTTSESRNGAGTFLAPVGIAIGAAAVALL